MNYFEYLLKFSKISSIIKEPKIKIGGINDGFNINLIALDFYSGNSTIFVVLPSLYLAQNYYDNLINIIDEDDVLFFPSDELISTSIISASGDFLYERIQTIFELLTNDKKIVVMNMNSAIKYEMSKNTWSKSYFHIKKNDTVNINELINKLYQIGYRKSFQLEKTGQFSRRGSIIDIFPLGYENPIRIDLFGDDVDIIKEFNIETQRSIKEIEEVLIIPVSEFIYDDNDLDIALSKLSTFLDEQDLSNLEREMYDSDILDLRNHNSLNNLTRYISFFDDQKSTIFDFSDNKKIYIIDSTTSNSNYNKLILDLNDYCSRISGYSLTKMDINKPFEDIINMANVLCYNLIDTYEYDVVINAKDIEPYLANQVELIKDIKAFISKYLFISIQSVDRLNKLKEVLDDNDIIYKEITDYKDVNYGMVNIIKEPYPSYNLSSLDIILINEKDIFEKNYKKSKPKYKSIFKNAKKISSYDELEIGDYVVNYDYGVGIYRGIKTIKTSGFSRDFIAVEYKNNSELYVTLEKINDLNKYAPKDTVGVEIHEIGSSSWARTKAKVKNRIHDISDKLIKIYSERKNSIGFKYPADSVEQIEFENDFEYELTPDQLKAVNDIKRDMESTKPMDRLICGDVGYGKTEVALRAAFKAVYAGKQVALLAPTTILSRQHYQTFYSRMDKYGIRVELLSRLIPKKQQDKIIEDLKKGSVDIVIGTHRLLNKEITYKDLGLLIIDEEQRFGVSHKERIKELKVNVDCITLSATPIPRTLQMSIMGIKDLSMIETPPKNRYPIQTYVLERNDRIIRDAIIKEISRGGQVFYLYNWTESIEDKAIELQKLVPEAKICIAHGKMTKDKMEDVIIKFINKEYNVLLCTTIIETGIDMPDTNTLIINDSDRLGLSQLYQIRGRVGRSNKIAYAYLMYEPYKKLTEEAKKRLKTIKEFNELGSGFKIAMRDLSIRGSGDLLGEEQSGFVETVGIDMYLKILDEEINKKQEETKIDPSLTAPLTSRTISSNYIYTDDMRIKIHKRINSLSSINELNELKNELIDRFGDIPSDTLSYMYEKLMDNLSVIVGVEKIDKSKKDQLIFKFSAEVSNKLSMEKLFKELPKEFLLSYTELAEVMITIPFVNRASSFEKMSKYLSSLI